MATKKILGSAVGLGGLLIAFVAVVQAQVTPAQQSTVHTAPKTQIVAKQMAKSSDEGEDASSPRTARVAIMPLMAFLLAFPARSFATCECVRD